MSLNPETAIASSRPTHDGKAPSLDFPLLLATFFSLTTNSCVRDVSVLSGNFYGVSMSALLVGHTCRLVSVQLTFVRERVISLTNSAIILWQ